MNGISTNVTGIGKCLGHVARQNICHSTALFAYHGHELLADYVVHGIAAKLRHDYGRILGMFIAIKL